MLVSWGEREVANEDDVESKEWGNVVDEDEKEVDDDEKEEDDDDKDKGTAREEVYGGRARGRVCVRDVVPFNDVVPSDEGERIPTATCRSLSKRVFSVSSSSSS